MEALSDFTIAQPLVELFDHYPAMTISAGDSKSYRHFRSLEPTLSSCVDDSSLGDNTFHACVVIDIAGEAVGMASFVVSANRQKKGAANRYGRIDLVVTDKNMRGFGVGRLLVLSALVQLLSDYGHCLYSVSCLAAHPAMEQILEEVGFNGSYRQGRNFKHEEIAIRDGAATSLTALTEKLTSSIQQTNYRLRQNANTHAAIQ